MHGSFWFPGSGFGASGLEVFAQSDSCLAPQELSREPHEDPSSSALSKKALCVSRFAFSEAFALSDSCLSHKPLRNLMSHEVTLQKALYCPRRLCAFWGAWKMHGSFRVQGSG